MFAVRTIRNTSTVRGQNAEFSMLKRVEHMEPLGIEGLTSNFVYTLVPVAFSVDISTRGCKLLADLGHWRSVLGPHWISRVHHSPGNIHRRSSLFLCQYWPLQETTIRAVS